MPKQEKDSNSKQQGLPKTEVVKNFSKHDLEHANVPNQKSRSMNDEKA